MNEKIELIYVEVIEKLKKGHRPQIKLDTETIEEIAISWSKALESFSESFPKDHLKKIFCILDNSQNSTDKFDELFLKTLNEIKDHDLIVYCLSASQKHMITESFKSGKMISFEYFNILKKLINHSQPEVKEWSLRTIETLGPLSLRLKDDVLKAKPGLDKLFNKHKKASAEIIEALERDWKKMKL